MRLQLRSMLLLVFLSTVAACGSSTEVACPAELSPGIVLTVVDAKTGELAGTGSNVTVWDGAYTSEVLASGGEADGPIHTFYAAPGRPGTYSIRIEHSGYADWVKSDIIVRRATCGVRPVRITAKLIPLSS